MNLEYGECFGWDGVNSKFMNDEELNWIEWLGGNAPLRGTKYMLKQAVAIQNSYMTSDDKGDHLDSGS